MRSSTGVSNSRPWPRTPSRPIPAACPGSSRERPAWPANGTLTEAQAAPSGTQVGFLQDTGSMSQTVYLDAGTYQVSFLAAQDTTDQTSYQEIEVLVDGTSYGIIDPTSTAYASYQSSAFPVAAGPHTIELLGVDPLGGTNTAFLDQVSLAPANAISDGSFETPAMDGGTYQFAPTGSPWQFSGGGGIATNASTYTSGNPTAPDGCQVAMLQGNGSMSQSVDLPAGSYNISFQAAQCATNAQAQGQQIEVLVDGAAVGLITPVGTGYGLYETSNFSVATGTHTIEFLGTNPQGGDNTALIDLVSLTAAEDEIIDGGFESPVLAANSYQAAPSGTPWQFSGLAGMSANGSGVTSGNPNAPDGAQVGFIMNEGSISYSLYLDADTYNLSFLAAQRANDQSQSQQIEVLVDGAQVGWITPSGTTYTLVQHVELHGRGRSAYDRVPGDEPASGESTALIDQVTLATAENTFTNGGFESPVLAANAYAIAPAGSGWQFSGDAGVSTNNSGFTAGSCQCPRRGPRSPSSRTTAASANPSTSTPARTTSRSWPPSDSIIRPRPNRSRCWSTARKSPWSRRPPPRPPPPPRPRTSFTLLTRRRISRSRPARIRSNSWAPARPAPTAPPSSTTPRSTPAAPSATAASRTRSWPPRPTSSCPAARPGSSPGRPG